MLATPLELLLLIAKTWATSEHNGNLLTTAAALFSINLAVWATWRLFVYPFFFCPLRHLPSPANSSIFFGNASAIFQSPPGRDFLEWIEVVPNDGMIYFRGHFNQASLLLTSPQALADVVQKNCYDWEKPKALSEFLGRLLGEGLNVVEGAQHKFQRKALNPAFHTRAVKDLHPLFWKKSQALVHAMTRELTAASMYGPGGVNGECEMTQWASRAVMDIIGIAALGRDLNTIANPTHPILLQFLAMQKYAIDGWIYLAGLPILPQWLVERSPIMGPGVQKLRRDAHSMIQDQRRLPCPDRVDILSTVLRAGAFEDDNLVDQLVMFLAAGHSTAANTLTWACYLLATHQDVQNVLRKEIRAAISSLEDTTTTEQLDSLPLLHGVINEAFRLFPVTPLLFRESIRPTVIRGQQIPTGTQVILCPWAINRSTELWGRNAGVFAPERWIDCRDDGEDVRPNNHGGASSNYAMLTFLQGPHRCIGEAFSRSKLRCLVAALVGSFRLEMVDSKADVVPTGIIGMHAMNGMHLRIIALEDWGA